VGKLSSAPFTTATPLMLVMRSCKLKFQWLVIRTGIWTMFWNPSYGHPWTIPKTMFWNPSHGHPWTIPKTMFWNPSYGHPWTIPKTISKITTSFSSLTTLFLFLNNCFFFLWTFLITISHLS
jgi:hypothetical protein